MPIPTTATAIPRSLARLDVYRTIKQWILDLQLAPGEIIRDQDLAARLGVSRTPVREALRQLEDEGLIQTRFHKWTRVAPVSVAEAEELYPAVAALEAAAVELAMGNLSGADLARLSTINKSLAQAIAQGRGQEAADHDSAFHALLIERCGNREIGRLLDALLPRLRRIELAHFGDQRVAPQSVAEHDDIITALRRHDGAAAAAAMKLNWQLLPEETDPTPMHEK